MLSPNYSSSWAQAVFVLPLLIYYWYIFVPGNLYAFVWLFRGYFMHIIFALLQQYQFKQKLLTTRCIFRHNSVSAGQPGSLLQCGGSASSSSGVTGRQSWSSQALIHFPLWPLRSVSCSFIKDFYEGIFFLSSPLVWSSPALFKIAL